MARIVRRVSESEIMLPLLARTASSSGEDVFRFADEMLAIIFTLNVASSSGDGADRIEVFVQTSVNGTAWFDVASFPSVTVNDGSKEYVAKLSSTAGEATFEMGVALSGGDIRNILGNDWRVRYDITDIATPNAEFVFSVSALPV